jgi:hypothetical protein
MWQGGDLHVAEAILGGIGELQHTGAVRGAQAEFASRSPVAGAARPDAPHGHRDARAVAGTRAGARMVITSKIADGTVIPPAVASMPGGKIRSPAQSSMRGDAVQVVGARPAQSKNGLLVGDPSQ